MTITAVRKCPICEGSDSEILHTQKFVLPDGHPLSDGYNVVCCTRCGFVYADTTAAQEDYDRFYAQFSKYEDQQTASGTGETPCDAKRLRDTARQVANLLPSSDARILDMGCANGGLLKSLRELGFKNLCGIDPSPACVANVRRLGLEAHVGSLLSPPSGIGQFDCVILSHVLEHVQDLKRATQAMHALTKPRGCIYAEVPDAARYADYVFAPFQDFNTEHINHFSNTSLSNLMLSAGFSLKWQGEKVIESSPKCPYPSLWGVWLKTGQPSLNFTLTRDKNLAANIRTYIEKSQTIMNGIEIRLREELAQTPQVIVWGAGQLTMKLLVETSLASAPIAAFVDGNPINQGKKLRGILILSPEQMRNLPYPIIVATILQQQEIAHEIYRMGLSNRVILLG